MHWQTPRRTFDLTTRGLIMGVLNVTPDSFSDGGQFLSVDAAVARGLAMVEEGADILDIGGESTRPGAGEVPADEELRRVLPVIRALRQRTAAALSIDTMKAAVARAAVEAGAEIINDVSGFDADPDMAAAAAETGAAAVLMHMQGRPRTMQVQPHYDHVVPEVAAALEASIDRALAAGVRLDALALDPGIGFGKTLAHNVEILGALERFSLRGRPVLLGVSRKSFLGRLLHLPDVAGRQWPTVALTARARLAGVRIFRVHDVRENTECLRMTEAILTAR